MKPIGNSANEVSRPSPRRVLLSRRDRGEAASADVDPRTPHEGFTLVELLVVIGIIAVLIAILMPALSAVRKQARSTRELAALKQVMTAYEMYASENQGLLLPGYYNGGNMTDGMGTEILFPTSARYPWRLAPYLQYTIFGTIVVNGQEERISRDYAGGVEHGYMVSLYPSFGINGTFLGGMYGGGLISPTPTMLNLYGSFCARKAVEVKRPADLIVFASARSAGQSGPQEGYFVIEPPYLSSRRWAATYNESDAPENFGYVHPRHPNKRAAAGFLDGHAETLSVEDMQDMRHWSPQATRADWTLGSP